MEEPAHLAMPSAATQNGDMIIEVGIDELKADLPRCLQAVQDGHEVLIKDGDRPVARLVAPKTDVLEITPATTPVHELAKLERARRTTLTPEEIDRCLAWTRADRFDLDE